MPPGHLAASEAFEAISGRTARREPSPSTICRRPCPDASTEIGLGTRAPRPAPPEPRTHSPPLCRRLTSAHITDRTIPGRDRPTLLLRSGSRRARHAGRDDRFGRRAGAQVETAAPRRMERSAATPPTAAGLSRWTTTSSGDARPRRHRDPQCTSWTRIARAIACAWWEKSFSPSRPPRGACRGFGRARAGR
jgi:hypothetical protein